MSLFGPEAPIDLPLEERFGLVSALRRALLAEPCVRVAFLHGSFARGEPFRDLDVGVQLDEPFRILAVGGLAHRLWAAIGRPGFDVDVVPLNDAPAAFRWEVAQGGQVLRERRPGDAADFAVRALSERIDFNEARRVIEAEARVAP
ncbi:MAG: nucleotidyltransferase domain-containing protein [Deltaproteobacteria bacterium]|nr:nucleotidyltransferase domain-containing protein [Deltaproteobacteria bacterium]